MGVIVLLLYDTLNTGFVSCSVGRWAAILVIAVNALGNVAAALVDCCCDLLGMFGKGPMMIVCGGSIVGMLPLGS